MTEVQNGQQTLYCHSGENKEIDMTTDQINDVLYEFDAATFAPIDTRTREGETK